MNDCTSTLLAVHYTPISRSITPHIYIHIYTLSIYHQLFYPYRSERIVQERKRNNITQAIDLIFKKQCGEFIKYSREKEIKYAQFISSCIH